MFRDAAVGPGFVYVTKNGFTGRKYFIEPFAGGVAILDYDNDGDQDIYLSIGAALPSLEKQDASQYNALLRNNGTGSFEDVTAAAKPRCLAIPA